MSAPGKITIPELIRKKKEKEKTACLTAYDWTMGRLLDEAGIDLILVGDSAGMVMAGRQDTVPVTIDEMLYHTKCVRRAVKRALLVADMPFLSYQINPDQAVKNCGRFLKEAGADAVKIEGGAHMAQTIQRLVQTGIPVMGHLGLTPQSVREFGGYRVRGKEKNEAEKLADDAKIIEQAGVFSMVLEKVPADLAAQITASSGVPTIGIGAGPHCDGQILVTHDALGLFEAFKPRFVRRYAHLAQTIRDAAGQYKRDVEQGDYPSAEESY